MACLASSLIQINGASNRHFKQDEEAPETTIIYELFLFEFSEIALPLKFSYFVFTQFIGNRGVRNAQALAQ